MSTGLLAAEVLYNLQQPASKLFFEHLSVLLSFDINSHLLGNIYVKKLLLLSTKDKTSLLEKKSEDKARTKEAGKIKATSDDKISF